MDGGIVCPIPFKKALEDGAGQVLVVTTRERGFRKAPKAPKILQAEQNHYSNYPAFADLLARTPDIYNEQLDESTSLDNGDFCHSPGARQRATRTRCGQMNPSKRAEEC